jgi:hypothetical protein
MLLKLVRTWRTEKSTIGLLYAYNDNDPANSIFRCFTLEDVEREVKIKGQTAIPKGTYEIAWTWSPKFKRDVLMLLNVPNFERIYFHGGNKSEDTEGCILCGLHRNPDNNKINFSAYAIAALYQLVGEALEKKEKVQIEIG